MNRKGIFDTVKLARSKPWTEADVAILDAALDQLGLPRDDASARLFPSRAALALIRQFEGCKLTAYPDPATGADPWTIGWGATGPGIRKGVTWTQEEADARLKEDVDGFADGVAHLVADAATTQGEFDALVSFAFNVGLSNLKTSTLLKLHRPGDKAGAAAEFARWNKAAGKVLPGLTRRRAAEAALYRGEV